MYKTFAIACIASAAAASFARIEDMLAAGRPLGAPGNKKLNLAQSKSPFEKARMEKLALIQSGAEGWVGEAIELPEVRAAPPKALTPPKLAQAVAREEAPRPRLTRADEMAKLAQVTATSDGSHDCLTTNRRMKADTADFWKILSETGQYTDDDFTASNDSLMWKDQGESNQWSNMSIDWKRATDLNINPKSLFGDGISVDDINQGYIGNCWFMAAASAVAETPGRLESVFLNTETDLNPQGIYAVNFYALGVPHSIVIDDQLPVSGGGLVMAQAGDDGSLWGALLEKAFSKYWGNYLRTEGGLGEFAVRTMTGAPYFDFHNASNSVDTVWNAVKEADEQGDLILASTPGEGNHDVKHANGLSHSHQYTIVGVKELSNGVRLVKVRNPWGTEGYHGPWSDESDMWTDELRAEVDLVQDKKDGFFYMAIEDAMKGFDWTTISHDVEGWSLSTFLVLDDDMSTAGNNPYATGNVSGHNLKITSDVAQTIYVQVNTWDTRSMPRSCMSWDTWHMAKSDKLGNKGFYYGQMAYKPYQIAAGESIDLLAAMNWNDGKQARDFSVTVWGEAGPVTITHADGLTSAALPVVPPRGDAPEPVDPEPVDPEPVDPEPVDPEPVDPEPVDPEPVDPEPEEKLKWMKKFDQRVNKLKTLKKVDGVEDCYYGFVEGYNWQKKGFESRFKIDCPSQPERTFHFWITMELEEYENLSYSYYDIDETTGEHGNCTASKQMTVDPYEYQDYYENGLTVAEFTLSHGTGQTQGGFVGTKGGLGQTGTYVYTSCWSCDS